MHLARRIADLGTESAFEWAARARALEASGRSIVHLELGEPDFDTPAHVRLAADRALEAGATHYAPYPGIPDLRRAIAEDAGRRRGIPIDPEQVFVTVGGKSVILYAMLALVEPGDEVLVPDPGYPIYASLARFLGARAVPLPTTGGPAWRLDIEELERHVGDRTRLLVLNSPSNPTGFVLGDQELEAVAEVARRHDLVVLADEIYSRITYDGATPRSIAALPGMAERTIILDGFSKTYAMTGWRLGYAIVPPELAPVFGALIINSVSCAPTFIQWAAIEALRGPQEPVAAMVAEFAARRDLVVEGLDRIRGIRCPRPAGAFYVFPDVAGTGLDGATFAERLLDEAGVCVLPGTAFGERAGTHVRLSYAASRSDLEEALRRIAWFVDRLGAA
jgi:aspartate/methionine/tyrosine aminotransferase